MTFSAYFSTNQSIFTRAFVAGATVYLFLLLLLQSNQYSHKLSPFYSQNSCLSSLILSEFIIPVKFLRQMKSFFFLIDVFKNELQGKCAVYNNIWKSLFQFAFVRSHCIYVQYTPCTLFFLTNSVLFQVARKLS